MIPLFKVSMSAEAKELVGEVLDSGYIGQGAKVEQFEKQFAELAEAPHEVLTVNSCTSAIDLALHLIGVGPGDEVITTPMTCTASNSAVVTRGSTPVWADVDPTTGLIDPASVHRQLTRKTKAIIAVDWAGEPCDYAELKSYGVPVIEDAAHALLATIGGQPIARVGGDYVAWSFQAIKHLTTGDGGALLAPAHQIERARLLRWYGLDRKSSANFRCEQNIREVGYKYHMNDIAAAIGLANLPTAKAVVDRHRHNAAIYAEAFEGFGGRGRAPRASKQSSWWLYTLLVDSPQVFVSFMKSEGIEASPVHARNDKHTAFLRVAERRGETLRGVDLFAGHEVAIPVGWWIRDHDVQHIIATVRRWYEQRARIRFA
jgi:dTDP-4-amino-4,6-dideoxygalactose transaminase